MANIPIYPGSSSFFPGDTPFGFYDNDYQFQQDADKVTKLIDAYLFDASFEGTPYECPYNDVDKMFDMNAVNKVLNTL